MLLKPRKKELQDYSEATSTIHSTTLVTKSAGLEEVQISELVPRLVVLKESIEIQKL